MQHQTRLFQRLSLGMVVLLIGLLAIGPFLHSHLGASVVSGFHMDGVRSVAQADSAVASGAAHPHFSATDDESPALGVATSLPNSDQDHLCVIDMTGWLAAILLVNRLRLPQRARPLLRSAWPSRTYQAGWPPPALAPPSLRV